MVPIATSFRRPFAKSPEWSIIRHNREANVRNGLARKFCRSLNDCSRFGKDKCTVFYSLHRLAYMSLDDSPDVVGLHMVQRVGDKLPLKLCKLVPVKDMGHRGSIEARREDQSGRCSTFDYFILFYCLFVPTIGTLAFFVILDHLSNERLAIGGAACVYLSSFILGLSGITRFAKYSGRADFWALLIGIVLSGISGLVAVGALFLIHVAAELHIN